MSSIIVVCHVILCFESNYYRSGRSVVFFTLSFKIWVLPKVSKDQIGASPQNRWFEISNKGAKNIIIIIVNFYFRRAECKSKTSTFLDNRLRSLNGYFRIFLAAIAIARLQSKSGYAALSSFLAFIFVFLHIFVSKNWCPKNPYYQTLVQ